MRLPLFLRLRRRLLMQLDTSLPRPSSSSLQARLELRPSLKRTYSQQAAQLQSAGPSSLPPSPPSKLPRRSDDSSTLTKSKRGRSMRPLRKKPPGSVGAGPSSLPSKKAQGKGKQREKMNVLSGPCYDAKYLNAEYLGFTTLLSDDEKAHARGHLNNVYAKVHGSQTPQYVSVQGVIQDGSPSQAIWRTTVTLTAVEPHIVGIGDHSNKSESVLLSAQSAFYQLHKSRLTEEPKDTTAALTDGTVVDYAQALSFMEYYCQRFSFRLPDIEYVDGRNGWKTMMTVGGRRIGLGLGNTKKSAMIACYLDVTKYLETCDPELWKAYVEAEKTGKHLGLGPPVYFQTSYDLGESIGDISADVRKTSLYRNRPSKSGTDPALVNNTFMPHRRSRVTSNELNNKSATLLERRQAYLKNPLLASMRETRMALPVHSGSKEVLKHIEENAVTICMAATGSGKTTQIPQMILDDYIDRNMGAKCNIICTQPRRLAAISVAHRVAKERGEALGKSLGYQVRFDVKSPEPHGSITFCTTGVFLKRLQSALGSAGPSDFDDVTHVIVDEVHERDIDVDLLLVVLKQIMALKKARNQQFKVILMSATVNPTLFQEYFKDDAGVPASVITIPGRSFPVTKYFMDDFVPKLLNTPMRWIFNLETVAHYIRKELGLTRIFQLGIPPPKTEFRGDDLDIPFPLIAAQITDILQNSNDGHILVFLPGWQDMVGLQKALFSPVGHLPINFKSPKYSLHMLHSAVPLQEQQAVFEPPAKGVRRIILATNIAETSITIPDIVYVIDTAKIKEQRYDPDKHMSSLTSTWVGSSNINQRAGRAGRHRSGEYYGLISKEHVDELQAYQTVEMKRADLSNVVMHVKALNFPGMSVEDVLSATIEPPPLARVESAIKSLQMVGAIDPDKNLTSLGRVLLHIPIEAQVARLVLYGSFFRCLDPALTLAAILTNRDPFMQPLLYRDEARAVKKGWTTEGFRSDSLATLKAFNAWWALQSRGDYNAANRFCVENFLSKTTLLLIQNIKGQLLQSLYRAGVIEVSGGGSTADADHQYLAVPPALNINKNSYPLLTALIAIASQPKFSVSTGPNFYRTSSDKVALIHPSSANFQKVETAKEMKSSSAPKEKQLLAFVEKRRNDTTGNKAQTFLTGITHIDPLTYILFGAYHVDVTQRGLECDGWLPIIGDVRVLDQLSRLKQSMEACMLRVFEGINMRGRKLSLSRSPREDSEANEFETEDGIDEMRDLSLSSKEIRELDLLTKDIVGLLNRSSDERFAVISRQTSHAPTPIGSPRPFSIKLPGANSFSGYSTPSGVERSPSRRR